MSTWDGIWLGLIQGFTEFLPVSSSGHLVLAESLLGVHTPGVMVEVVLHVATLLAILIVYRGRLISLSRGLVMGERAAWNYAGLIVLATIPAVIAGLMFKPVVEGAFDSTLVVGIDFIITAAVLFSTRLAPGGVLTKLPGGLGSLGIGVAQAFAILPGVSRSGTTVAAAMWLRVDPVSAAEFSFIIAIPAITGAMVLELPQLGSGMSGVDPIALIAGFATALVSGIIAIRLLIVLLKKSAFHKFAPYLLLVGAATVILWLSG